MLAASLLSKISREDFKARISPFSPEGLPCINLGFQIMHSDF
jgi:hypothetical protein